EAYALQDNDGYNLRADHENSTESIFATQYAGRDGTGTIDKSRPEDMLNYPYGSPFNCCGFYQPPQDLVSSFQTNAQGLPMPDSYHDHMLENDMGIASNEAFTIAETSVDPRLDYSVGRRGVAYKDSGPHPGAQSLGDQTDGGT